MKTIYLLVGPKGSGKSYIGQLLETHFHIRFARVEEWAKNLKRDRQADDESYVREAFEAIERGVRKELETADAIVFESTGLTEHFDAMYARLKSDFTVISVFVRAEPEVCFQRVKERDQSAHINVSDEMVLRINKAVQEKGLVFERIIDNSDKSREELLEELNRIVCDAI